MTRTLLRLAVPIVGVLPLAADMPSERARVPFTDVATAAGPAIVKLYGVGVATEHGYGTGVLVSSDGKVVTTLSLLLETPNLRAVTSDGHLYRATVTWRDPVRQLALLELQTRPENVDTDLPTRRQVEPTTFAYLRPADSHAMRPGDWIVTLGNPFKVAEGEEPVSAMAGVFSARTRLDARHRVQDFPYRGDVLIVDAITGNPGSPGSALLDLDGRWVGLVGKIAHSRLTNTRLNYAIPAEEIAAFLDDARHGRTTSAPATRPAERGYHGISLFSLAYRRGLPFVERVELGSPAERAGVRKEDLILSANSMAVPDNRAFDRLTESLAPGDELSLVIKRGNEIVQLSFELEKPPS